MENLVFIILYIGSLSGLAMLIVHTGVAIINYKNKKKEKEENKNG